MLVLSRKVGEKIHIGSDIVVTVVEIKGNRARLAIEAPDDVRILRHELADWLEAPAEKSAREGLVSSRR
jgi:carbon storage regulator